MYIAWDHSKPFSSQRVNRYHIGTEFGVPRMYVCAECFADPGLKVFVRENVTHEACSFCNASADRPIAADVDEVIDYMRESISQEYDLAANHLYFESREDGYQGPHWDSWDLLNEHLELELPNDEEGRLLDALVEGLGGEPWCEANPYGPNAREEAAWSWERFCHVVKHERRFFFLEHGRRDYDPLSDDGLLRPDELLKTIFSYASSAGLLREVRAGWILYRARRQKPGERLESAEELGPPPTALAKVNRMSPPGIVMFYASDSLETALRETAKSAGTHVIGRFTTRREVTILDLSRLPKVPTIFERVRDTLEHFPRRILQFLHHVARELSIPVQGSDTEDVHYVPTQIVTEYARSYVKINGRPIDGIRYRSAVHPGGFSVVLFADQDNLFLGELGPSEELWRRAPEEQWLKLIDSSERSVATTEIEEWVAESEATWGMF